MVALLLCASGCASRTAAPAGCSSAAAASAGEQHDDVLMHRLMRLAPGLEQAGHSARGVFARGFLAPSTRASSALQVPANTCVLMVALASPSLVDLDASFYLADGTPLAQDEGADSRPSVSLCAGPRPVRAHLVLHAYVGAGAFVVARFERPATGSDVRVDLERDQAGRLIELLNALRGRGFDDEGPPIQLRLSGGVPTRVALGVEAGRCYAVVADLTHQTGATARLLSGQGVELARGVSSGEPLALQYCAPARDEVSLELIAPRPELIRLLRMQMPQELAGGSRSMWLGEPQPSPRAWAEVSLPAPPDAEGRRKPELEQDVPLDQGKQKRLAPRLLGRCERWEVTLRPGLAAASLRIEDAEGVALAQADTQGMHARLEVCDLPADRSVVLVGRSGFGELELRGYAAR